MKSVSVNDNRNMIPWDEKLVIFIEFKRRSFGLKSQDNIQRLNDKDQRNVTLFVILSEAKNLLTFIEFLTPTYFKLLKESE